MAGYTKKQKEDYKTNRNKYICCPKCGKHIISLKAKKSNEKMRFSAFTCRDFLHEGFVELMFSCGSCGDGWAEVYALVDIDVPTQG